MTAREMHYDFKQKMNRIDSQQNRGFKVPEIDWKLNEAQELFVKIIAEPRIGERLGLEYNQRTIDDIRTIVVDQKPSEGLTTTVYDDKSYTVTLPPDYWFLASARVYATKGTCVNTTLEVKRAQHDDEHEISPFDKSSFEWRVVNIRFNSGGIRIFTDGTFVVTKLIMEYLKQPRIIHNAADWQGGSYVGLDGKTYTGRQDSVLPVGVHREIVDLAVMIAAGDINLPDYQLKQNKVRLNN